MSRKNVGRTDRQTGLMSSDIESSSATEDSDADVITADKYNSCSNGTGSVLAHF